MWRRKNDFFAAGRCGWSPPASGAARNSVRAAWIRHWPSMPMILPTVRRMIVLDCLASLDDSSASDDNTENRGPQSFRRWSFVA